MGSRHRALWVQRYIRWYHWHRDGYGSCYKDPVVCYFFFALAVVLLVIGFKKLF